MRWVMLILLTLGGLAAEDQSYAQHLREILARYATVRVTPPAALVAAIADPPAGQIAAGSPASDLLFQAQQCLDYLADLTVDADLLPAARILALSTYCREQADAAVAQILALHPGPTQIPPEVVARRSPLQAIGLILFVGRTLRGWQHPQPDEPASPLRADAEQRLRSIVALADKESATPWPNSALDALESAAWDATNAGNWRPLRVEGDETLATAFLQAQRRPRLAALAAIDALVNDPARSAPPPETYAMRLVAEAGSAVVGSWDAAHRDLQAIMPDLTVLPQAQNWHKQAAALTTELNALRDQTIAALQTGDLSALQAGAAAAIDLAGVVAILREVVTQERAFADRLAERREAFANEIPAQCLATALAAWRAAQTAAGEARRRVIALERRMTVLGSGDFSVIQVLNAEVIAANQALDESLRQLADPAPMTPRGR